MHHTYTPPYPTLPHTHTRRCSFNSYMPVLFDDIGKYRCQEAGFAVLYPPHGPRAEEGAILDKFRVEEM